MDCVMVQIPHHQYTIILQNDRKINSQSVKNTADNREHSLINLTNCDLLLQPTIRCQMNKLHRTNIGQKEDREIQ